MYSINMLRLAALSLVCLLGTTSLREQGAAAAGAAGTRIGVINMLQAITLTAEGKQAAVELQSQFAPRQQELESLDKQINDLQQKLTASRTTPSDAERTRLTDQGNRLAQRLDRKRREYQEDLNAAQGEVVNSLGRKMADVLNRYAEENNYATVLDSSAQNSPVLYASKNIDLTQDIIRLYDQAYPAKEAAPASKPAPVAPKPPPATKPQ